MCNIALSDAIMALVAGIICGIMVLHGVPPELNAFAQLNSTDRIPLLFHDNQSSILLDMANMTDIDESANFTTKR